jgi:crossover junction endodeoxyribonuclease RusA
MADTLTLTLPWPPKALSPNARLHYMATARAKASYRKTCAWTAREQGARRVTADRLHVSLTFYPPTRHPFDLDNARARMKAGLDGLADVLGVDDSRWSISIARAGEIGGFVKVDVQFFKE